MMMGLLGAVGGGTAPSWQTTFAHALTVDNTGWNGFNLRQVINAAQLSLSGSLVRVTIQASTAAGGFTIDHAEIGHAAAAGDAYDFDGGQVALTFNTGSASVVLSQNTQITSDAISFSLNNAKNFIVAAHFSATSAIRQANPVTGTQAYFKSAASEVSVSDVSTYTTAASNLSLVNLIEVFA